MKTKLSLTVRTDDFTVHTRNVDQHGHTVTSRSSGLLCYYFQLFCMIKRNSGYSFVLLSQKAKQKERGSVNKKKSESVFPKYLHTYLEFPTPYVIKLNLLTSCNSTSLPNYSSNHTQFWQNIQSHKPKGQQNKLCK